MVIKPQLQGSLTARLKPPMIPMVTSIPADEKGRALFIVKKVT